MHYSVISTGNTGLYGSQPSSVVFACKTAGFGPEIQVCMGPRHHLSLFAFNTVWLVAEILVSKGPSPLLRFWHARQRPLYVLSNLYGSQTSLVVSCMQNSAISTRISSLYGSLPSSVAFDCKTATVGSEIQVSMGPRHRLSLFACNTVWLVPELLVSMSPSPHLWFLHAKQRLLD